MQDPDTIKQPDLAYPIHPLIAARWSTRAFDFKPIESNKLQSIFEAARWSASAFNLQPWYFMVGMKGDKVFNAISETLSEFNRLWAGHAPLLVLAIARNINPTGESNKYAEYDLGQSVAILSLQALNEGIFSHQMAGFDRDKITDILEIPKEFKAMVVIAMGYRGKAESLQPLHAKLEYAARTRRPVSETVFTGSFGDNADFL